MSMCESGVIGVREVLTARMERIQVDDGGEQECRGREGPRTR